MPPRTPHLPEPKKSLMRSLGEFFGHIAKGVTAKPSSVPGPTSVHTHVTEERGQSADGSVLLRRTTIEEIELLPPLSAPPANPGPGQPVQPPPPSGR